MIGPAVVFCTGCFLLALFLWGRKGLHETHRQKVRDPRLLIFLGSGGHTAEILALLQDLPTSRYRRRIWMYSAGDELSCRKALQWEERKSLPDPNVTGGLQRFESNHLQYDIANDQEIQFFAVRRARRVRQSYITTPWTCVLSLLSCIQPMLANKPDLIVLNGPGTAVMVAFVGLILRATGLARCQIIYVESFARVRTLNSSCNGPNWRCQGVPKWNIWEYLSKAMTYVRPCFWDLRRHACVHSLNNQGICFDLEVAQLSERRANMASVSMFLGNRIGLKEKNDV